MENVRQTKNEITDEYCERAINRKGELIKDIIYKGYESERMVEFVFLSLYKDSKLFDYIKNNLNDSTAIYILKKFEEFTKIKSKFNDEKYKDTISRWENMYNAYKLLNS